MVASWPDPGSRHKTLRGGVQACSQRAPRPRGLAGGGLEDFSSDLSALTIVELIDLADCLVELELYVGQDDVFWWI